MSDTLQGICGAALALEVYALTGPFRFGFGEVLAVGLLGAWVAVGVAHLAAAVVRHLASRQPDGS